MSGPPEHVFAASSLERWKRIQETVAKLTFMAMTMVLVFPVLAVFGYLVVKAWPVISISFLLENPREKMTAGGIWSPLVGTFSLVFLSLVACAPVGILAGIYPSQKATTIQPVDVIRS